MKLLSLIRKLAAVTLVLTVLPGCTTACLWSKKSYQPAAHPRLALALHPGGRDVLVCYDEQCGKSTHVHRRAYWLFANTPEGLKRPKPHFVDSIVYDQLKPVTVTSTTNTPALHGYWAVASDNSFNFDLFRDNEPVGSYRLPVYTGGPPVTWWRVGLTPVTVATDAAIVGAYCMGQSAH